MKDQKSNNRRQFLKNSSLAAFALGVDNNLIKTEKSNQKEDCNKTTLDAFGVGPYYTPNPPALTDNKLAKAEEPGERIVISGQVRTLDCSKVIAGVLIDIWHADDAGAYDNAGYNLRGTVTSNDQGFYMFETIRPGKYANRPSHIHFKITPPGFETLITQLYFEGDTSIPTDPAASFTDAPFDARERIIPLKEENGKLVGTWDIIVDGQGITTSTGLQNIHLDKGMIYNVSPNPFTDQIEIFYGVFEHSKVNIAIFDFQGREMAKLEEQTLSPEKYTAVWNANAYMPSGHYFIVLKINDLQVHYLKIVKV